MTHSVVSKTTISEALETAPAPISPEAVLGSYRGGNGVNVPYHKVVCKCHLLVDQILKLELRLSLYFLGSSPLGGYVREIKSFVQLNSSAAT